MHLENLMLFVLGDLNEINARCHIRGFKMYMIASKNGLNINLLSERIGDIYF